MVIPAEITAKHGVNQEEVFRRGPNAPGIDDAVFEFATVANDHLITARDMFNSDGMGGLVPPAALPVFLSAVCTQLTATLLCR
jgi:NADH dehydrogenase [ubiquinone] 1 alpha subcomplex assembly factor 6